MIAIPKLRSLIVFFLIPWLILDSRTVASAASFIPASIRSSKVQEVRISQEAISPFLLSPLHQSLLNSHEFFSELFKSLPLIGAKITTSRRGRPWRDLFKLWWRGRLVFRSGRLIPVIARGSNGPDINDEQQTPPTDSTELTILSRSELGLNLTPAEKQMLYSPATSKRPTPEIHFSVIAGETDALMSAVQTDPYTGAGGFASPERFEGYLQSIKHSTSLVGNEEMERFVTNEYGRRLRRSLAKLGIHDVIIDLVPMDLWDDYDLAFSVRNIVNHEGRLYISLPRPSRTIDLQTCIAAFMGRIATQEWGADVLATEGLIVTDPEKHLLPVLGTPRMPTYYLVVRTMVALGWLPNSTGEAIIEKAYPYAVELNQNAAGQLDQSSAQELANLLWSEIPEYPHEPIYMTLSGKEGHYDIATEVTRPRIEVFERDPSSYVRQIIEAEGLELRYTMGLNSRQLPFLVVDLSSLWSSHIREALNVDAPEQLRKRIRSIQNRAFGFNKLVERLLNDAANAGHLEFSRGDARFKSAPTSSTKNLAQLPEFSQKPALVTEISFRSDSFNEQDLLMARSQTELFRKTHWAYSFYGILHFLNFSLRTLFPTKEQTDLVALLLRELLSNSANQSHAPIDVLIEIIESTLGAKLLKAVIHQEHIHQDDWERLLVNSKGYAMQGLAYLEDRYTRRINGAADHTGGGGLQVFAILAGKIPSLLRYFKNENGMSTELYVSLPDKGLGKAGELHGPRSILTAS